MNDIDAEFNSLMDRIRTGEQEAAWQLLELYGPHILRVVRRHLSEKLRSKFDSIDFVQSVWASFFRQPDCVHRFGRPHELVAFLVSIARNKVYDEMRRRVRAQKYNVDREQALEDMPTSEPDMREPIDTRQPRPSEVAVVREQWTQLFESQPPRYQRILELRFRGASYAEIADSLQIHERTARRVVDDVVSAVEG